MPLFPIKFDNIKSMDAPVKGLETVNISQHGFSILQIETKSVCNMQCKFCPYLLRNDKRKTLPDRNILDIIDSLHIDSRFEYICFSQFNEPLLDNRIYDFIKYAKNRKLPVLIITNGLQFNSKDVIHNLIEAGPDYIKISLQTLNAKTFNSIRGINSSFPEYKKGIFEFLKAVRFSVPKVTIDVACNFMYLGRKIKATLLGLEQGDPSVYNTIDDLRCDIESFLNELSNFDSRFVLNSIEVGSYLDKVGSDYLNQTGFNIAENISIKIKPFTFGKKLTEFFPVKNGVECQTRILGILADGHVVPCCLAYGDMLNMGNIKESSLKKILDKNINLLDNIRKGINLPLICKRCLGAPTKRGAMMRPFKNIIIRMLNPILLNKKIR